MVLAGGVLVAGGQAGAGGGAMVVGQQRVGGRTGRHGALCETDHDHQVGIEADGPVNAGDLHADPGAASLSEGAPKFGGQSTPKAPIGRMGFDVVQLGQGIEDRAHLVQGEEFVGRPGLMGGGPAEVLAKQVADGSAPASPGVVFGEAVEGCAESLHEGGQLSGSCGLGRQAVGQPGSALVVDFGHGFGIEFGGQVGEAIGPLTNSADHAGLSGQPTPGACRYQVVVGVPEGHVGHQGVEVASADPPIGKIEESDQEASGDRLVESVDAVSVEFDACSGEPLLDQSGVVGGRRVDEDHTVQRRTGSCRLDDPSDGVANGLVLFWGGCHEARDPRSGRPRLGRVDVEDLGQGSKVGVDRNRSVRAVGVTDDGGEVACGGQRTYEPAFRGDERAG